MVMYRHKYKQTIKSSTQVHTTNQFGYLLSDFFEKKKTLVTLNPICLH